MTLPNERYLITLLENLRFFPPLHEIKTLRKNIQNGGVAGRRRSGDEFAVTSRAVHHAIRYEKFTMLNELIQKPVTYLGDRLLVDWHGYVTLTINSYSSRTRRI